MLKTYQSMLIGVLIGIAGMSMCWMGWTLTHPSGMNTVQIAGQEVNIPANAALRVEVEKDQGQYGGMAIDKTQRMAKSPDWIGNSRDRTEEVKFGAPDINITTTDRFGQESVKQQGGDMYDQWKAQAKWVPIIIAVAGVLMIIGAVVVWALWKQTTIAIALGGAGIGLIILAFVGESAVWLLGALVVVAVLGVIVWLYLSWKTHGTQSALDTIVPGIEELRKVQLEGKITDYRDVPPTIKENQNVNLAELVTSEIAEHLPSEPAAMAKVKAFVSAVKAKMGL